MADSLKLWRLRSVVHDLRLLLDTQASVMTPNGADFPFLSIVLKMFHSRFNIQRAANSMLWLG